MRPKRGSGAWIRYGERLADGEIAFAAAHYRTAILQPWETEAAARLKDLRDDMVILAYRCLSSARDFEPAHRRASGLGFAEAQRRGWLARRASGRALVRLLMTPPPRRRGPCWGGTGGRGGGRRWRHP